MKLQYKREEWLTERRTGLNVEGHYLSHMYQYVYRPEAGRNASELVLTIQSDTVDLLD